MRGDADAGGEHRRKEDTLRATSPPGSCREFAEGMGRASADRLLLWPLGPGDSLGGDLSVEEAARRLEGGEGGKDRYEAYQYGRRKAGHLRVLARWK